MPADPTSPTADIRPGGVTLYQTPPLGDICQVFLDGSTLLANIYSRGAGYTSNCLPSTIPGPTTFTISLVGMKIPMKITVFDTDTAGPSTTDTDHDLGPSATSVSITLASNHECATLAIRRRF